jgi:hypothetical protein
MDYIKDLFTGKADQEHVHQKFVKYSKGTFIGPAIVVKKTAGGMKISGSHEYVDAMVGLVLRNTQGAVSAAGNVFSKSGIETDLAAKSKKRMGVYNTEIKGEADAKALLGLYEQNPEATFYLDLETDRAKLKTKKKAPRPGASHDDEFFSATLDASFAGALAEDICFDCAKKDYRELRISHRYHINGLVIPDEYKNDAAKARLSAKRKGTVKRTVEIDGEKTETEKVLLV